MVSERSKSEIGRCGCVVNVVRDAAISGEIYANKNCRHEKKKAFEISIFTAIEWTSSVSNYNRPETSAWGFIAH